MGCVLCLGTRRSRLSSSITASGRPNSENCLIFRGLTAKPLIPLGLLPEPQPSSVTGNSKELGEKNHLVVLRGEMPQLERSASEVLRNAAKGRRSATHAHRRDVACYVSAHCTRNGGRRDVASYVSTRATNVRLTCSGGSWLRWPEGPLELSLYSPQPSSYAALPGPC